MTQGPRREARSQRKRRPEEPLQPAFLNLHKPSGVTSHDAVDFIRQLTGDRRVGHCGTLDPRASGVLPLCVGSATRLADHLVAARKSYRAVAVLDCLTDTADLDGQITVRFPGPGPTREAVEGAVSRYRGAFAQQVPLYSAVRVGGERLHELARAGAGDTIERPIRDIVVHAIDVLAYEWPRLELAVTCSKGTYVRQLAVDIGAALGVGGALDELVRTAVGGLTLDNAVTPARLAGAWVRGELAGHRVPWSLAFEGATVFTLRSEDAGRRLGQGMMVDSTDVEPSPVRAGTGIVLDARGEPFAVCELVAQGSGWRVQPRKVLVG